jgi:hypothetical protein
MIAIARRRLPFLAMVISLSATDVGRISPAGRIRRPFGILRSCFAAAMASGRAASWLCLKFRKMRWSRASISSTGRLWRRLLFGFLRGEPNQLIGNRPRPPVPRFSDFSGGSLISSGNGSRSAASSRPRPPRSKTPSPRSLQAAILSRAVSISGVIRPSRHSWIRDRLEWALTRRKIASN